MLAISHYEFAETGRPVFAKPVASALKSYTEGAEREGQDLGRPLQRRLPVGAACTNKVLAMR